MEIEKNCQGEYNVSNFSDLGIGKKKYIYRYI